MAEIKTKKNLSKNQNYYDESYYKQYEEGFKSFDRPDHKKILDLCKFNKNDKVLEIGCGYGVLLSRISCKEKIGLESNQYVVNYCTREGLDVRLFNVEKKLDFKKNSFDYVVMNEVIEHLSFPEEIIKDCFRILKPHGKIIITTTAKNFFNQNVDISHISELTILQMEGLLLRNGYIMLEHLVSGISPLVFLLNKFVFQPSRLLRKSKSRNTKVTVSKIQNVYNNSILNTILSKYRKNFLILGTTQIVLAQKVV